MPVRALTPRLQTPKRTPGGRGQHDAVVLGSSAQARPHDEQRAEPEQAGLEGSHRGNGEPGVRAVARRQRDREQHEPDERQREPPPLPLADPEAEHVIGHHREQHEPTGQHDLNDGQRRQRDRADVQHPGDRADEHADRERALTPQRASRSEGVADVDGTRRARSAVLVEERQVGGEGAQQREEDAELKAHEGISSVDVRGTFTIDSFVDMLDAARPCEQASENRPVARRLRRSFTE